MLLRPAPRPAPPTQGQGRFLTRLGIVLAILLVLVSLLAGAAAVLYVREAADRLSCNLGGVSIALFGYQDAHGELPPAIVYGKDGTPLHSWRVLILPHLGEEELFKQFRLDEPWDSQHNLRLLPRMPKTYAAPGSKAAKAPPHHTFLHVFVGKGTAFEGKPGPPGGTERSRSLAGALSFERRMAEHFPDGPENTFLFVEAGEAVPWTRPLELHYDPAGPLPRLRGPFRDFFRACTADGRYRYVRYDTPYAALRARITRNGGDDPGSDW